MLWYVGFTPLYIVFIYNLFTYGLFEDWLVLYKNCIWGGRYVVYGWNDWYRVYYWGSYTRSACIRDSCVRDTCIGDTSAYTASAYTKSTYAKNAFFVKSAYISTDNAIKHLEIYLQSFRILEVKLFGTG